MLTISSKQSLNGRGDESLMKKLNLFAKLVSHYEIFLQHTIVNALNISISFIKGN